MKSTKICTFTKIGLVTATLLTLSACGTSGVNTGSGQAYRQAYEERGYVAKSALDAAVRDQQPIEPLLRFPARFGIARIEGGRLTSIPSDEQKIWSEKFREYGTLEYGTIEPVNPVIAEIAVKESGDKNLMKSPIARVRLGGAAQQLDAVFIYEVQSSSQARPNVFSLTDLTIVGAYIAPSRRVSAVGEVNAVLMDVRNGYPYITASQSIDKSRLTAVVGENATARELRQDAITAAVEELSEEVVPLVQNLKNDLESNTK